MNSPRFTLLGPAVLSILFLGGVTGFAQNTDSYSVQSSAGNSTSPVQPPPGSPFWELQQRQAALGRLQQEIDTYKAAKDWTQIQNQIANDKRVRAYENASDLFSSANNRYGADHVNGLKPNPPHSAIVTGTSTMLRSTVSPFHKNRAAWHSGRRRLWSVP